MRRRGGRDPVIPARVMATAFAWALACTASCAAGTETGADKDEAVNSLAAAAAGNRVVMLTRAAAPPEPIKAAASAVAADPLLGGVEKVRYLRFKTHEPAAKRDDRTPPTAWWVELIRNLSTGMRIAMWLLGAALLIGVLLRLRDWVKLRGHAPVLSSVAPTHVGSLDIRPESLPDDIGAAARDLWRQGQARSALSLLYRGALSRLVHAHAVPIRAASTESDCLSLSEPRLASPDHRFLAQLVAGWQTVAYAGRDLDAQDFEQLCAGFDVHLTPGVRP